jgi:hypothetical protein
MSFPRHEEIYRPMATANRLRRPLHGRPNVHRYDEFPAGYSLVGCAPAEPASASPAGAHPDAEEGRCTIEKQRTANRLLTGCLTAGDNFRISLRFKYKKRNKERFFASLRMTAL